MVLQCTTIFYQHKASNLHWGVVFIDCWVASLNANGMRDVAIHRQFYKRAVKELNNLTIVSKICCGITDANPIDPIIEETFDNDTIYLNSPSEFVEHQHKTNNWIIVGAAWGICVHYGPMGVNKLVHLEDHNFHIFPEWSIFTEDQQYVTVDTVTNDRYRWRLIRPGCYKLEGQKC